jgi:hypothetical protein
MPYGSSRFASKIPDLRRKFIDIGKGMKITCLYIILITLLTGIHLQRIYSQDPSKHIEISEEQFLELAEELDYTKTKRKLVLRNQEEKEKLNQKEPKDTFGNYNTLSFFQWIAYLVIALLILFIIYTVFSNVKIENLIKPEVLPVEIAEDIDKIESQREYEKAIAQGDFRMAIRMQYIRILQYLDDNKFISWKPDKTNRHYLGELRQLEIYDSFRELSHIYEWVWYGNTKLGADEFSTLDPKFNHFLESTS